METNFVSQRRTDTGDMVAPPDSTIAVIGSGIAGLAAAWLLSSRHRVTLIEREARLGGHSNTVDAPGRQGPVAIDTGFIVYNSESYPNLVALLDHLGVRTARTSMSFAVSLGGGDYEYSGTGVQGLFGQPLNALSPAHWRMIADIRRFFREARAIVQRGGEGDEPLGAWLVRRGYSRAFVERHVLPMGAAIWSTPTRDMLDFPVGAFARFFANHGLLQVRRRPEWRTVVGGSREYVARLLAAGRSSVVAGDAAVRVVTASDGVEVVHASGRRQRYDHAVLACHADEALALLAEPASDEARLLGAFRYAANRAVLHRDPGLMPRRRRVWASWNFIGGRDVGAGVGAPPLCVSYWMNRLQPLTTSEDHFVTLNPIREPAARDVVSEHAYTHPILDGGAIAAQPGLWSLQGRRRLWLCGSYFGYGFHEDGLQSALAVAEALGGVRRPWTVGNESGRIHLPRGWRPEPLPVAA